MLCFPQVLFAGAMVPIGAMTGLGEAISSAMSNRWAFEALGRLLDLGTAFGTEPGVLADWEHSLIGSAHARVLGLVAIAVVCALSTIVVLRKAQSR